MSIAVDIITAGVDLVTAPAECRRRQRMYAMRAAHVMAQYVPIEEGTLRGSEKLSSDYDLGIIGKSREWLSERLTRRHVKIEDVVLFTVDDSGKENLIKRK